MKKIEEKIEKKKLDLSQKIKVHGQKALSRHEMELERSLLRDCESDDSRKVMHALTTVRDPREITLSNDPMNQLPEILEKITRSLNPEGYKRRKRKRKNKHNEMTDCDAACPGVEGAEKGMEESSCILDSNQTDNMKEDCGELATCAPRPLTPVPEVTLEDIQKNRLTSAEIKMISRFENYCPGDPSNVSLCLCLLLWIHGV